MSPDRPRSRYLKAVIILMITFAIWAYGFLPSFSGSRKSRLSYLHSKLQQIELAKQLWAKEHNATNGSLVSQKDLHPYLSSSFNFTNDQIAKYLINLTGEPPSAVLLLPLSTLNLPKGTLLRYAGTNGAQVKLPQSEAWEPLASARKRRQ